MNVLAPTHASPDERMKNAHGPLQAVVQLPAVNLGCPDILKTENFFHP